MKNNNVKIDYVYTLFNSFNISSAIWVLYLRNKGMSLFEIGMIEGIFHVTGLISEVPSGIFADLVGRKRSIVIGRILSLISCLITLFSNSFLGVSIGFVLSALSYNLNSGSEDALVYDSLKELGKEEEFIKINGRRSLLMEVGQGLASFIGWAISEISFALSYVVSAIVSFLSIIIASLFKEIDVNKLDNKERINKNKQSAIESEKVTLINHIKGAYEIVREDKAIINILIFFSCIYTFSATIYFYGQDHLASLGYSKLNMSFIFLAYGSVSAISAIFSDKMYKAFKERGILIATLLLGVFITLTAFTGKISFVVVLCITGGLTSILQPISSNMLNERIESSKRATLISLESMCYSFMMIILFPTIGLIGDKLSLERGFLIIGVITIVSSLIEIRVIKTSKERF
ncbi:MFS transporter [Clostridium sp.]|uniref:MFS transporter n=1 Tax=Clostridium sp. TaxID=1506 RepID=UPI002633873F|nr:MFS transporter [Clostridium sp.]